MAKVQSKSLIKTAPGGKQNVTAAYPKNKLEFNFFFFELWSDVIIFFLIA